MANPSRSETAMAEDCDWSFVGERAFEKAIDSAVRKAASRFDGIDEEDVRQDAILWLAVRPELIERHRAGGTHGDLAQNIYANGLRPSLVRESDRQDQTDSRDELLEED